MGHSACAQPVAPAVLNQPLELTGHHRANLQPSLLAPGARMLQIPRARLSDGGEYTCTARNQAGESQKKSFLTVLGLCFTVF